MQFICQIPSRAPLPKKLFWGENWPPRTGKRRKKVIREIAKLSDERLSGQKGRGKERRCEWFSSFPPFHGFVEPRGQKRNSFFKLDSLPKKVGEMCAKVAKLTFFRTFYFLKSGISSGESCSAAHKKKFLRDKCGTTYGWGVVTRRKETEEKPWNAQLVTPS